MLTSHLPRSCTDADAEPPHFLNLLDEQCGNSSKRQTDTWRGCKKKAETARRKVRDRVHWPEQMPRAGGIGLDC